MSHLSVTEALTTRKSVRVFDDKPVPQSLLREILALAGRSASGGNVQPWKVDVLTGDALKQLAGTVQGFIQNSGGKTEPEFPTYPNKMADPYHERRGTCGEVMYEALGIARDDKMKRIMQTMKNYDFFGAPVGIILSMEREMGQPQCLDIGIYMQSIMLLAKERGLDTCPQVSWTVFPQPVREALGLDDNMKIMAGICLGYKAEDQPVNELSQARAELSDYVTFRGFE
ncbi:nitroreductase [Amphritea sp. HPY]|uniref:nitroreductase n=1 Tax=Amphritea sp. HPY TaxID=3421652 RepID=UPI003D7D6AD7